MKLVKFQAGKVCSACTLVMVCLWQYWVSFL